MSFPEVTPFAIVVQLISTGGADKVTLIPLPPATRLVTIFPVGVDVWLTDRGAAGTAVEDAFAFPVLSSLHNEMRVGGWPPAGAILRLAGAMNTKVRILCQK